MRLDPVTGAVASLVDKRTGRESLAAPFPVFEGRPNPTYTPRSVYGKKRPVPERYDSSGSKAVIDWVERGPLRASARAQHNWPMLKFETRVNLCAGLPYVEVVSRVLSEVRRCPTYPRNTEDFRSISRTATGCRSCPRLRGCASVVRDFPLENNPTRQSAFHALTFVDLAGADQGLLLLHPGTQYFKRTADGRLSNLVMREWESYFTGEYGWPRYCEYRHVLMPHSARFDNAARMRASTEFSQTLMAYLGAAGPGALPARKSFLSVSPENVHLLRSAEGRRRIASRGFWKWKGKRPAPISNSASRFRARRQRIFWETRFPKWRTPVAAFR